MRHVLGQDRVIETLQAALRADRIPHAWIFHGPPGVGKRTTAEAFAAALLDPEATPGLDGFLESDPQGHVAKSIAAGNHPDCHGITKEWARYSSDRAIRERKQTSIPVEVIREFLIGPASRSTLARGGARASKVFIVDEAEMLAGPAQNALLKTLEEPPPGTVLILVTSSEDELLPTIRSRCQRVAFTRLSDADMMRWLKSAAPDAAKDGERRAWLLRFAQGSPGMAKAALDHDLYDWFTTLEPMLRQLDAGEFPAEMGAAMAQRVDGLAAQWVKDHANASKEAANRMAARYLFILLAEEVRAWLHTMAATAVASPADPSAVEPLLRALDLIRDAERQLDANVNLALLLDNLVIQWADRSAVA